MNFSSQLFPYFLFLHFRITPLFLHSSPSLFHNFSNSSHTFFQLLSFPVKALLSLPYRFFPHNSPPLPPSSAFTSSHLLPLCLHLFQTLPKFLHRSSPISSQLLPNLLFYFLLTLFSIPHTVVLPSLLLCLSLFFTTLFPTSLKNIKHNSSSLCHNCAHTFC